MVFKELKNHREPETERSERELNAVRELGDCYVCLYSQLPFSSGSEGVLKISRIVSPKV